MNKRHCPHVVKEGRVGDEQDWCVVCLRGEVKDLKARLRAARATWFGTFPEQGEDWDKALWRVTDLRRKNWRKP